ncbi:MAG: D-alanyl-D-alanine carboxypeptidase/D-alanyl-D-alanine-endopeptidase [Candidatus Eremiobacteraeota bacterium]|nr:D-alanyl-D-alanine carboxypeptidase/D-alanyl-D-alanine-endopeptidase [Candidatus Eremiobacteraeota bacterium]
MKRLRRFFVLIAMRRVAAAAVLALFSLGGARAADMSSTATLVRPAPGGAPWTAAQITALQRRLDTILNAATLRGAHVGIIAIDTVRKTPVYVRSADDAMMPASNFKLLVGSAALATLGTTFTYVTTVGSDGTNLYLRGGGDSLLKAKDLDAAAAAIAAQGITRVTDVVTDATYFDNQRLGYGWSWDDLPYYYAPVVSALGIEDHVAHVFMSPGDAAGTPVKLRVEPQTDAFTIDNQLTTADKTGKDTSDIVRPWDEPRTIRLTGTYPLGAKESGDLVPAVPDPESYAGDVFLRALRAHGVTVSGTMHSGVMPSTARSVWTHNSEPMPQLLADFWYPSDNLMGELLLKELGVHQAQQPGSTANGAKLESAWLKSIGVDPSSVTIGDGSGLSQYDRITPRGLLTILEYDWNSANRDVVLDALPVSGVRGTLKSSYIGTPAEKTVWAKTGSISHVRTISGFVKTKTHGPLTFSFMINDWMGEDQPHGGADLAKVRAAFFAQLASE